MGKHSKNSNDRAFFSYHERKAASYGRLSSAMLGGHNTADGNHQSHGWGTMQRTLDGDAMKEIDACSLSLQACVNPVVTANGILYDKQVIVEYILSRKKVIPPPTPSGRQPLSQAPLPALSSPDPRRASNAARPAAPDDALLATPGARAGAACVGGAGGGGGSRRRERGAGGATGTDRRVRRAAGGTVVRPTSPNPPLPPPRPVRAPSPDSAWPCCVRRQSDLSSRTGKTVATASTMGAVRRLRSATAGWRLACTGPPANRARAREGRLETRGAPQKRHTDWFDTPRPFAPFV